jgi:hypothetical protein
MNNLAIDKKVYFDCSKIQLKYSEVVNADTLDTQEIYHDVNRYVLVRNDTGKELGIHSADYIIRPYAALAEQVNEVVRECVDINKYNITTKDHIYESGKKFRRDINFWDDSIDLNNYKRNGFHIEGTEEKIIPQLRIYSSMDGRWGQQIMWSSVYVVCLNGMVRPDWTFVIYNKHNKRQDISFDVSDFKTGLVAHNELGEDLFKMMQKKVTSDQTSNLFQKTLASDYAMKSLVDHTKSNVMKDLNNAWQRYESKYGSTLFAAYQTATDWASHPVTKGAEHNVSRKREKQVAEMMTSSEWRGMAA